jgi:hypothetical protein
MPLTGYKYKPGFSDQMAAKIKRVNGNITGAIPRFGLEVAHIHTASLR